MSIKSQIDADLKVAMLSKDKALTTTLRGLKSAILYVEVAEGKRESGLGDDAIVQLFRKEVKKRQESADLYAQGGNAEKAQQELAEKLVIEKYLPAELSDEKLNELIAEAIQNQGPLTPQNMGQIIGAVKNASAGTVDGARIAQVVKAHLA